MFVLPGSKSSSLPVPAPAKYLGHCRTVEVRPGPQAPHRAAVLHAAIARRNRCRQPEQNLYDGDSWHYEFSARRLKLKRVLLNVTIS